MQENNNVWIFERKALVAFVVAVLSALGTLVGTLNNTAQINTIKDQNVRIEQKMRSVTPAKPAQSEHVSKAIKAADKKVEKANQKADTMERHAAEMQKENELLQRQTPNK